MERPVQVAVGLGQVGEFSFMLASLLFASGAIPPELHAALLAVVAISIAVSTIVVRVPIGSWRPTVARWGDGQRTDATTWHDAHLMQPMRSALLWSARNAWMRDHVPRLPFAQRAVRRFMPGERVEDALAAADRLNAQGFGVLFTHLGENLTRLAEADAVAEHYHDVLERGRRRARPIEISVKPTQLGLDIDEEACLRHCESLATHAEETGTWLWLDMEGTTYTEVTVALYERLKSTHAKTGIALQAYLRRTAADVQRILPLKPAVRLVKGAYDEPSTLAFRGRSEVDGNYHALAVLVAQAAGKGDARLALGTHDVELIGRITTMAEASGTGRDALEVHMLYGVRADQLARLTKEGYSCSSLVAYGEFWYAWYMRRLAERPANIAFALRQLLP